MGPQLIAKRASQMNTLKSESIFELASLLSRQQDYQEIMRLVTQKASALLGAEIALVMMINPQTRDTIKTIYKAGKETDERPYQLVHTYFSGWVIEHNKGFISEYIHKDSRFRTDIFSELSLTSVLCLPLRAENLITGTLLLMNQTGNKSFNKDDYTFLEKFVSVVSPFLRNIQKLEQYFVAPMPEEALLKKYRAHGLLGRSELFINLLQSIEAAAGCDVRVLLEGQSGTGKELVARAIHHSSARSSNKFIAIDCGAIPRELIESELFGHVKGAFTGAGDSRMGLMEEANGGTLFMDEISNLPLDVQTKLLRVLQEKEIRPLGSNQLRKINVRIIAASSGSLRQLVDSGKLREDLFYRLYVYPIELPSLDQRKEDIPQLANHFLRKFVREQQKRAETISGDLIEFLKIHTWTGNVRELENMVERLVTMAPPEMKAIDISILPTEYQGEWEYIKTKNPVIETPVPLRETVAAFEKQAIENALVYCEWNQSRAARILQISEHSIRYKMKNHGITRQH
jgi:Nif-specific regulatory protein